jgi:hypothetical protein
MIVGPMPCTSHLCLVVFAVALPNMWCTFPSRAFAWSGPTGSLVRHQEQVHFQPLTGKACAAGMQRAEDGWHPAGAWMDDHSLAPIHCKQGLDKRHLPDRCSMN